MYLLPRVLQEAASPMDPLTARRLPARSAILDALRATGRNRLLPILRAVLEQADDALFDFAQRSGSSSEQQPFLDAMREVRRERANVEQRFASELGNRFGSPETTAAADQDQPVGGLSLIDVDTLETHLACEQLISAAEKRNREVLVRVNNRLRHADQQEPGVPAPSPEWARQIALSFDASLAPLELALQARLVLYKLFERQLPVAFGELLAVFDRQLHQAGMVAAPLAANGVRPSRAVPQPVAEMSSDQNIDTAQDEMSPGSFGQGFSSAHHAEQPRYGSHGRPGQPGRNGPGHDSGGGGAGTLSLATDPHQYGQQPGPYTAADGADEHLFGVMREALALHRRRNGSGQVDAVGTGTAPLAAMPRHVALDALSLLQSKPPAAILEALDNPFVTVADILTRELMGQAQSLGLPGGHGALEEPDAQALALVGMLFDVLLSQRSYRREVRQQFLRLSVPYAKAAMLDTRMFALKSHPARRLLDALAEASDGNQGESSAERDLLARVDDVIDRLLSDFNEDVAIFAALETDFRTFLDQHRRKIQLAEQRVAESQRGRERLDEARARSAAELEALIGGRLLPESTVGTLLREAWTHHLTMVALRDGIDCERFREAKQLGSTIWNLLIDGTAGHREELESLRPVLIEVLGSSGQHGESATSTADALIKELCRPTSASPIRFRSADASAASPVVLEEEDPAAESAADVADIADDSPQTAAHRAQLSALDVGHWVEFVEADGSVIPAKLSWVSPISKRLLFVNRRGTRHCMASIDELVDMIVSGALAMRGDDGAFGRAMAQVLGQLKESPPDTALQS